MIRMIKGTYGMQNGARVIPIRPEDGPFSLEPDQEKRLVNKLGVAEYVDDTTQEKDAYVDTEYTGEQPDNLHDMTKNQLLEMARNLDIKPTARETKEELIQRIEDAQGTLYDDESENMIPAFNAESAVQ